LATAVHRDAGAGAVLTREVGYIVP